MKKINSFLVLLVALSILSGCISGGHKFNNEKIADLELHKMKKSEYKSIFGEHPFKITDIYAGGDKYQIVWYHFGYHHFAGNFSFRNLFLEFKNEELNGYMYASSFADDKTVVNISKVENVKIGVSTRDDVISVLGKPYGKAFCPSQLSDFKDNCTKPKEVWEWFMFQHGYANKLVEKQYVLVMFGEDGKVVDVKAEDVKY